MAGLHLVTGYKGSPHITAADQGLFNAGCVGTGDYVLAVGNKFSASITGTNSIKILDGSLVMNGRYVNLEPNSYMDVTITSAATSKYRNDIVAIRYQKASTNGVETVMLATIKGTETTGTATDPTYNTGSIINGSTVHDMPLYRVKVSTSGISSIEQMFTEVAPLASQHGHNLLINGDFNVNQRGTKSYSATTAAKYSVDMWRIFQIKLEKLTEGVKVTGLSATTQGYLTQFIQLGVLKTTIYTISAMVDDKVCTFTVTPGATAKEKAFEKFKITTLTTSKWDNDLNDYSNKLKINICPIGTNSITIKYIDVFEGTVAIPHKVEDPAVALMRCRRYVCHGSHMSPFMWYKLESGNTTARVAIPVDGMVAIPTIESCKAWFYSGSAMAYATVVNSDIIESSKQKLDVTMRCGDMDINERCYGANLVYILTCEPTDS